MTDITNIKPEARKIEILHPGTGEEIGVTVEILSVGDPTLKNIKRRITDERIKLESKGKSYKSEDIEDNMDKITIGAIVGWDWHGDITLKGEKNPEATPKNIKHIFEEAPWFRAQVIEAINDESAFFKTSKQDS